MQRVGGVATLLALGSRPAGALPPIQPFTVLPDEATCPGSIEFGGYGTVQIVASQWNIANEPAGPVSVEGSGVIPHYKGRSYFADACRPGEYNNTDYAAVPLLGRSITFTTNLAEAGCGCNVALYLTSLHQHSEVSTCKDYYCDANIVCGVACHEIDIMEANAYAFRSSLHTEDDKYGMSMGYGGGGPDYNGARDWTSEQYGPQGECINTSHAFKVRAAFPMDISGKLEAMVITLFQDGRSCNLTLTLAGYDGNATNSGAGSADGMRALGEALAAGMTPIASLWGANDMNWMDGLGKDKLGPCTSDNEDNCPNAVAMRDFYLEDLPPPKAMWKRYVGLIALLILLCLGALAAWLFTTQNHETLEEEEENADSALSDE